MAHKNYFLLTMLVSQIVTHALAQQPRVPALQPQRPAPEDVVSISVKLVQVDAAVTDKDGHEVTGLQQEDFEIRVNGQRRPITNFSYVPTAPLASSPVRQPDGVDRRVPPTAPRPDQVRRTLALVVDDLGLSSISVLDVRNVLKKFVAEQMREGDLVAILRTGEGMGLLQQFTSDKRLLYTAIERVRWNPLGRGGVAVAASMGTAEFQSRNPDGALEDVDPDQSRRVFYTLGTVGALKYIVRGLGQMPGRKSVILFSDGIQLYTTKEQDDLSSTSRRWNVLDARVRDAARALTREANRASVVIHTVEARGPQTMGGKVEDLTAHGLNSQGFYSDQEGLGYLADQTGGTFAQANDLNIALTKLLDGPRGYYLIGFKPDEAWFLPEAAGKSSPKIEVKVKRPAMSVRYRKGFYGAPDKKPKTAPNTPMQKLFAALTSPFSASEVGLRLTSLFGHDQRDGSFVRSLLYVDAGGLTFREAPDGHYQAEVNVLAEAYTDAGSMTDDLNKTFTIRSGKEELEQIRRGGFVYEMTMPVKKAGGYQLRVAVQDTASERVGSASRFIEVPDLSQKQLALSDIVVSAAAQAPADQAGGGAVRSGPVDTQATMAVRRFKRRTQLAYALIVFNAQLDQATGRPQLERQVVLYRDGRVVYSGPVKPLEPGQPDDFKQIIATGTLTVGAELGAGDYALQLTVTDKLAKDKKYRTATRWIDFEIVD